MEYYVGVVINFLMAMGFMWMQKNAALSSVIKKAHHLHHACDSQLK